jgi:uncharacterized membrane protein YvbJ
MSPDACPNCGAKVPSGAKACPECGSDEKTGWSEQARYDNLGLPDEHFDYDDFAKREFGGERVVPRGIHWVWWVTALVLVFLFLLFFFH